MENNTNLNNFRNTNGINPNFYDESEERKEKVITAILIGLIVIIVLILGYIVYNSFQEKKIETEAVEAVEEFEKTLSEITTVDNSAVDPNSLVGVITEDSGLNNGTTTRGSRVKMGAYDVVGTLRIPKTGIKYPILSPSDAYSLEKGLTLLESTQGINKPGNTTILGHNYRNNMFFSKNHTLNKGDKVYIKGMDGVEVEYTIYEGSMKKPNDADYMRRDTGNNTEISLSTCNTDSSLRYVLLARKTGE